MARAVSRRCDVPGCTHGRSRWMRLCNSCFSLLPGDIRTAIFNTKRRGSNAEWRQQCRNAAAFLQRRAALAAPAVTPERAAELQARLLGERMDP